MIQPGNRLGIATAFIAALLQAPTLRAETPATAPAAAPLVAVFSDGMRVELFSIFDGHESWWRPDGTALTKAIYDPAIQGNQMKSIEFLISVKGPGGKKWDSASIRRETTEGRLGFAGVREGKQNIPDQFRLIQFGAPTPRPTTMTLRFAMQSELIALKLAPGVDNAVSTDIPGLGDIELSNAREIDGQAAVDAVIPKPSDGLQVVVVAGPRKPKFIPPVEGSIGGTGSEVRTIRFQAPLADVAEFYIQLRDNGRWVKFHDISQKSGFLTKPTVELGDNPALKPTTQPSAK